MNKFLTKKNLVILGIVLLVLMSGSFLFTSRQGNAPDYNTPTDSLDTQPITVFHFPPEKGTRQLENITPAILESYDEDYRRLIEDCRNHDISYEVCMSGYRLAAESGDITHCDLIVGPDGIVKDACRYDRLSEQLLSSPEQCDIVPLARKNDCFAQVALDTRDQSVCDLIDTKSSNGGIKKDWCFVNVALLSQDIEGCHASGSKEISNYCIAVLNQDVETCKNLIISAKSTCIKTIAINQKDSSLCEEIENFLSRRSCHVLLSGDDTICPSIGPDRNQCILQAAMAASDSTLCKGSIKSLIPKEQNIIDCQAKVIINDDLCEEIDGIAYPSFIERCRSTVKDLKDNKKGVIKSFAFPIDFYFPITK